jgi:hypothetical protein
LNGLHRPLLRFVEDASGLGPAGIHVGLVEREGEVTTGDSSLMAYQIQLRKPRLLLIPIFEGADGDLVLEKRPRRRSRRFSTNSSRILAFCFLLDLRYLAAVCLMTAFLSRIVSPIL